MNGLIYENPKLIFPFFISCNFIVFPNEWPGLCRYRENNKVARNEKWKNQLCVFVYKKYGKYQSVSLERFIKHKSFFSEEWRLFFCTHPQGLSVNTIQLGWSSVRSTNWTQVKFSQCLMAYKIMFILNYGPNHLKVN